MQGRFNYVKYDEAHIKSQEMFKQRVEQIEEIIEAYGPGRAAALALIKLEETYMWIGKMIRDDQASIAEPVKMNPLNDDGAGDIEALRQCIADHNKQAEQMAEQYAGAVARLNDFMDYFDSKGGISYVPRGPFERASEDVTGVRSIPGTDAPDCLDADDTAELEKNDAFCEDRE